MHVAQLECYVLDSGGCQMLFRTELVSLASMMPNNCNQQLELIMHPAVGGGEMTGLSNFSARVRMFRLFRLWYTADSSDCERRHLATQRKRIHRMQINFERPVQSRQLGTRATRQLRHSPFSPLF